jgi:hypothetical protein
VGEEAAVVDVVEGRLVEDGLVAKKLSAELIVSLLKAVWTRVLVGVTGRPEKEEFGQATVCVKLKDANVEEDETEESAWDSEESGTAEFENDGVATSGEDVEAAM